MKNTLNVSEVFYSIQGEGPSIGTPAVFLRLQGCNLLCDGKWRCDTINIWKKGSKTPFNAILPTEFINHLKKGAHLVITGGEPLLYQDVLPDFIDSLNIPNLYIEIETNGTQTASRKMLKKVSQWNISPKLSNSGITAEKRMNSYAIESFKESSNAFFKFVISDESDVSEILKEWIYPFKLNQNTIFLMPGADTREKLHKTGKLVAELAKRYGFRYSTRLQIELWNRATGV